MATTKSVLPFPFPVLAGPPCRPRMGLVFVALGFCLMAAATFAPALALWLSGGFESPGEDPVESPWFFPGFIAVLVVLYASLLLIERGRRMRARPATDQLRDDPRPPVVFLRSFEDDDLVDPTPRMIPLGSVFPRRYEESLHGPLNAVGPMVSIGRPGNPLALLGGARLFVADAVWRDAVTHLRSRAAAVVLMIGRTEGLWWELRTSIESVPRERLLFFFPYVEDVRKRRSLLQKFFHVRPAQMPLVRGAYRRMERERQARYQLFCKRVQPLLKARLPASLGSSQFIDFTPQGTLRPLPTIRPRWWPLTFLTPALRPMLIDVNRTLDPFVRKLARTESTQKP